MTQGRCSQPVVLWAGGTPLSGWSPWGGGDTVSLARAGGHCGGHRKTGVQSPAPSVSPRWAGGGRALPEMAAEVAAAPLWEGLGRWPWHGDTPSAPLVEQGALGRNTERCHLLGTSHSQRCCRPAASNATGPWHMGDTHRGDSGAPTERCGHLGDAAAGCQPPAANSGDKDTAVHGVGTVAPAPSSRRTPPRWVLVWALGHPVRRQPGCSTPGCHRGGGAVASGARGTCREGGKAANPAGGSARCARFG